MAAVLGCSAELEKQLVAAAYDGNLDSVQLLLRRGANANYQIFDNGTTPLIAAAQKGHIEVAKALLAGGANINLVDHGVGTALFWAAFEGRIEMVNFMLERGALLNCSKESASYLIRIIQERNFVEVEHLMAAQFKREGLTLESVEKITR
jgi:uncharacterized protein